MDLEEFLQKTKQSLEGTQKALQDRTSQLQQGDPVFQNLVGQYNTARLMAEDLEEVSGGRKAPSGGRKPSQAGKGPPRQEGRYKEA